MDLEDIIASVDLVEYISQYTELTEKHGEFWGLSPFREEQTPSFSIRKETNSFYDFSSGIGGNIITFVKFYDNCTGLEAVNKLKQYLGYNGEICRRQKLLSTEVAKKYKKKSKQVRPVAQNKLSSDYMMRYENNSEKLAEWIKEGISEQTLLEYQVKYDAFSNRLVYPIRNTDGDIVNVGGRILDPLWKDKKLRKYTYFKPWGELNTIFGVFENLEDITQKREIILFEGVKSVFLANTWGIKNCGAILTSHLNPHQLRILAKLGCKVVFALDKDVDIRVDYNIKKLKQFANISYILDKNNLLNAKDAPVDKGEEVFRLLLQQKIRF